MQEMWMCVRTCGYLSYIYTLSQMWSKCTRNFGAVSIETPLCTRIQYPYIHEYFLLRYSRKGLAVIPSPVIFLMRTAGE